MNKLKEIRKSRGLTQEKLSEKADIDINTIKAYECGRRKLENARFSTIKKLIKVLDCKEGDII